jgi:hypothetical protein
MTDQSVSPVDITPEEKSINTKTEKTKSQAQVWDKKAILWSLP